MANSSHLGQECPHVTLGLQSAGPQSDCSKDRQGLHGMSQYISMDVYLSRGCALPRNVCFSSLIRTGSWTTSLDQMCNFYTAKARRNESYPM